MRAGPSQEEIRRHNLGALLRYVHVHGADLPRRTHHRARAQPQHHRRAHRRPGQRPGWSARRPRGARPGRATVAGRPARVGRGSTRSRSASRWTGCMAARVGLGGVVLDRRELAAARGLTAAEAVAAAGRVRPGDAPRRCRRGRCVGAGVAVCGMVRRDDGLVRLGPHHRLGRRAARRGPGRRTRRSDAPVSGRQRADLGALAEHARGVGASAATTSSTSTATSASAAASSPAAAG